jgi:hypothetical protein
MKILFTINDNRVKFGAKTINKYKKKDILLELQKSLLNNDL